jgi:hypothetical protein
MGKVSHPPGVFQGEIKAPAAVGVNVGLRVTAAGVQVLGFFFALALEVQDNQFNIFFAEVFQAQHLVNEDILTQEYCENNQH